MYEAIKKMALLGIEEYLKGMAAITIALLIIAGITKVMGPQSLAAAGAIAIISGAMVILAYALGMLAEIRWQSLLKGLLVIAAFFGIIGLAGYLLGPVVPVLLALGIAIGLIGLAAFGFGLGIFLAATGLVLLAGSAYAIAAAIRVVGSAIIDVLPGLADAFANAVINFVLVLAERGPELMTAFQGLIVGMLESITSPEFLPKIFGFVLGFITAMIDEFEKSEIVDKVITAGWNILLSIIKGVEDNIQEVVDAGLGVIEEFIAGMETGIPPLMVQASKTLITIMETLEEDVLNQENVARIIEIGISIAGNIIAGIIQGIKDGAVNVWGTMTDLIGGLFDSGNEEADSDSPSKRAWRLSKDIIDGLVLGLTDNMSEVDRAMRNFGNSIKRNLEPVVQEMANYIDREAVFSPVISPVLDLSKMRARDIEKLFPSTKAYAVAAAIATTGQPVVAGYTSELGISETQPAGVRFNQYNYSPKALDREAIYRQTRTQLAKLKEERAFG